MNNGISGLGGAAQSQGAQQVNSNFNGRQMAVGSKPVSEPRQATTPTPSFLQSAAAFFKSIGKWFVETFTQKQNFDDFKREMSQKLKNGTISDDELKTLMDAIKGDTYVHVMSRYEEESNRLEEKTKDAENYEEMEAAIQLADIKIEKRSLAKTPDYERGNSYHGTLGRSERLELANLVQENKNSIEDRLTSSDSQYISRAVTAQDRPATRSSRRSHQSRAAHSQGPVRDLRGQNVPGQVMLPSGEIMSEADAQRLAQPPAKSVSPTPLAKATTAPAPVAHKPIPARASSEQPSAPGRSQQAQRASSGGFWSGIGDAIVSGAQAIGNTISNMAKTSFDSMLMEDSSALSRGRKPQSTFSSGQYDAANAQTKDPYDVAFDRMLNVVNGTTTEVKSSRNDSYPDSESGSISYSRTQIGGGGALLGRLQSSDDTTVSLDERMEAARAFCPNGQPLRNLTPSEKSEVKSAINSLKKAISAQNTQSNAALNQTKIKYIRELDTMIANLGK